MKQRPRTINRVSFALRFVALAVAGIGLALAVALLFVPTDFVPAK
jgi:hypothetical protein